MATMFNFRCGLLMGVADSIPGISGGTIAMILGIYERLVAAISQCDAQALRLFFTGKWMELARRIDLLFLIVLIAGIGTGILSSLLLVLYLLQNHLPVTFAAFMGLILGSTWLLFRKIESHTWKIWLAMVLGALAAYGIVSLDAISGSEHLGYVFLCGMIAICAMILPGISGSYILLILGEYPIITGKIQSLLHGQDVASNVLTLAVFATGCVLGLVLFSKFLRWLLTHFHAVTMAVLCGFMLGSLKSLYPFQQMVGKKTFEPLPTEAITTPLCVEVGIAAVCGLVFVLVLHWVAQKNTKKA